MVSWCLGLLIRLLERIKLELFDFIFVEDRVKKFTV